MFGKKIKGSIPLTLEGDQFCSVWEGNEKDCAYNVEIATNADHYNLVYQDGKFLGKPLTNGGAVYPFSFDPERQGSRADKKHFKRAKVVCISSSFNFEVPWGAPDFMMFYNGKAYDVGASGTFYIEIDPTDAGRSADRFYQKMLTQGDPAKMTTKALRDKLLAAFQNVIGAKIEECLEEVDRPLSELVGLSSSEKLKISKAVYPKVKDIFADFGLTITKASENSIVRNLVVKEHV